MSIAHRATETPVNGDAATSAEAVPMLNGEQQSRTY
jgi:hypothetical protein